LIVGMMKPEEKPLPNDREGLERLLEELYERLQNQKRGYPDFNRSDPVKDRIEQVRSKIEQVKAREAYTGVPKFYTEPLPRRKKDLEELLNTLNQRLSTSQPGSRDFVLTKEKIEQVKEELAKIGSRKEWIWRIITFLVGIAVGLIPKIIDWLSK